MEFNQLINDKILCFDGAMGTMIQKAGLKLGELPEVFNIKHSKTIRDIHASYAQAGADILTTNTFGASEYKLKNCQYSVEQIIKSAVENAKYAASKYNKLVALDIGPIGQLLQPMGSLSFDDAYNMFKRQVVAGAKAGADLILIETMSDIYEAKAAILAAKENSTLPVICTLTFSDNFRTLTGTDPATAVNILQGLGISALGANCSLGPKELLPIAKELVKHSRIPIIVQPNAGLPRMSGDEVIYDTTPEEFAEYIGSMIKDGVRVVGGCCGTTPEFIEKTKKVIDKSKVIGTKPLKYTAVSSTVNTVIIDDVSVIGERINPTGKKLLKKALKENDIGYIINEAINQKEAGANILDINVGLPEINEKQTMVNVVTEVQSIVSLPLQIDSTDIDAVEAGVRYCSGKPLINSVNGKKESLEAILPIAKKYGACVLGLTLDEKGIPEKAADRLSIAKRIVDTAVEYGIPKEDVLIDCLVLTASAQQEHAAQTVLAVSMVRELLGVKTVLGVSNVSFGLPERSLLNRTFLAMALSHGLNAPILNPLSKDMMETVHAYRVLANKDEKAEDYVKAMVGNDDNKTTSKVKMKENAKDKSTNSKDISKNNKDDSTEDSSLMSIIIKGMKDKAANETRALLQNIEPLEIVDKKIVPALERVGEYYDSGRIFLPQLIQSAETVKCAFDVIKKHMIEHGTETISKGKIVLATVRGDIHDIGKNIVKVLLENHGYEVIDLGRDVPVKDVVDVVKEKNIKMVGLSALMTTTVKSMEETIKALRKEGLDCKVVVGGAVLNQEYSEMIGADYYAKDAQESVRIAGRIFS